MFEKIRREVARCVPAKKAARERRRRSRGWAEHSWTEHDESEVLRDCRADARRRLAAKYGGLKRGIRDDIDLLLRGYSVAPEAVSMGTEEPWRLIEERIRIRKERLAKAVEKMRADGFDVRMTIKRVPSVTIGRKDTLTHYRIPLSSIRRAGLDTGWTEGSNWRKR